MNAHEYLTKVRRQNQRLFTYMGEKKLIMQASELERVIVGAFEAGKAVGVREGKDSKSLFETVFGKKV